MNISPLFPSSSSFSPSQTLFLYVYTVERVAAAYIYICIDFFNPSTFRPFFFFPSSFFSHQSIKSNRPHTENSSICTYTTDGQPNWISNRGPAWNKSNWEREMYRKYSIYMYTRICIYAPNMMDVRSILETVLQIDSSGSDRRRRREMYWHKLINTNNFSDVHTEQNTIPY